MTTSRATFAIVLIAVLKLCGCNVVMTSSPMFRGAEAAKQSLRPGVWSYRQSCPANDPSMGCTAIPGFVVTQTEVSMVALPRTYSVPGEPNAKATYRLIDGAPSIIQVRLEGGSPLSRQPLTELFYLAIAPTSHDSQGRIDAADAWPIDCGPPPGPGEWNYGMQDDERYVTNHPLQGLKMQDGNCTPAGVAALRSAAAASRAWDVYKLQWVGAQ
jgi:hypothetical protein